MAADQVKTRWETVAFGPYRLFAAERRLEKSGQPVALGGRALDILVHLVEHAGEVVAARELIAHAWPNATIDPGALRVQIAALRKALGDGEAGARYVANVAGRGYVFVAPVAQDDRRSAPPDSGAKGAHGLPPAPARMVGRDETVTGIARMVMAHRFVTILGPGGIGKTTAGISVGHALRDEFGDAVRFVEFGGVSDPQLAPSAIASALGLAVHSGDPLPSIVAYLREQKILLILDCCEHLIEAVAIAAERIFAQAPQAYILATSRETMRVDGEHVHRLTALDCPPDIFGLTAIEAMESPAAQLFIERIGSASARFSLTDEDAGVVAEICRRLDGIPLAIELAAGRVSQYGIQGIAELLNGRFRLLWRQSEVALPRHRTLNATLDWSYNLLSADERLVLGRLAIFVGPFSFEAIQSVATDERLHGPLIAELVADLVAKSLVSVRIDGLGAQYRLLDTTRAYTLDKLAESGEAPNLARRHASYYRTWLERMEAMALDSAPGAGLGAHADAVGNIRSALEWSLAERGDIAVGAALAAAAGPFFMALSLLNECYEWAVKSIEMLDDDLRGTRCEMELHYWRGLMMTFSRGCFPEVQVAYTRAIEIAERLRERHYQLRLSGALHIYLMRTRQFHEGLAVATRAREVALELGDPAGIARSDSLLGQTYYCLGRQAIAQRHAEGALAPTRLSGRVGLSSMNAANRGGDRCILSRILWLRGFGQEGLTLAAEAVEAAEVTAHPVIFGVILSRSMPVFLYLGGPDVAQPFADRLRAVAEQRQLQIYLTISDGFDGMLALERGDAKRAAKLVGGCLANLPEDRDEALTSLMLIARARAQGLLGQCEDALNTVRRAMARVHACGDLLELPEMLRVETDISRQAGLIDSAEAEARLGAAIEMAKAQDAHFWELRASLDQALMLRAERREPEARAALETLCHRFPANETIPDLLAARRFLNG